MNPTLLSVMRARYWTTAILRIGMLLMFAWGTLQLVGRTVEQLPFIENNRPLYTLSVIAAPLRWLFPALLLIVFEGPIIRWLFPLPATGCPQCGYPIAGLPTPACPECGLDLPQATSAPSPDAVTAPDPRRIEKH